MREDDDRKHRITIGLREGFNNTISRITHRACGPRGHPGLHDSVVQCARFLSAT